jgi:hypothetical protein
MSEGHPHETLRREIDEIWSKLGSSNHYQVLGLAPTASRQTIHETYAALLRKLTVAPGTLPRAYTARIDVILRAVEAAFVTLSDPIQRLNYDRTLPQSTFATRTSTVMGERGSAVPHRASQVGVEPVEATHGLSRAERAQEVYSQGLNPWEKTPLPQSTGSYPAVKSAVPHRASQVGVEPVEATHGLSRAERAQEVYSQGLNPWEKTPLPQSTGSYPAVKKTPTPGALQAVAPIAPAPQGEREAVVVPPPIRRTAEMTSPFGPPVAHTPPSAERPTANPLRATMTGVLAEPSKLQADFDVLLQEIDRITASVQLCVSQLAEIDGPRKAQFHGTFHALTATRGLLASMLATREEAAGHWEAAAKHWQRAARAKPDDPSLAVRAAMAAQRAGQDPSAAAMLTKPANETSPAAHHNNTGQHRAVRG